MKTIITPAPLHQGSRVALVAPSGPVPGERLDAALASVHALGLEPIAYPSVSMKHGYLAGGDVQRARDVQAAFEDESIEGILCIRGGYGAQRLYPLLDFARIAQHPKRFLGYSDVTFFHIALGELCGFQTYHTPMPSTEWYKGLDDYSQLWLEKALFGGPWGELPNCEGVERFCVTPGKAQGRLVGGNLSLVASAIGTPYALDARDCLLFLEDVGEEPYRVDGMLNHLVASGMLTGCRGVILGYYTDCEAKHPENSLTLAQVFEELLGPLGIPVLGGVSCGHSEPTLSLPLGAMAEMDAEAGLLRIVEEE